LLLPTVLVLAQDGPAIAEGPGAMRAWVLAAFEV
jgi:hypothetical protein